MDRLGVDGALAAMNRFHDSHDENREEYTEHAVDAVRPF
jgi:hypothetical protein